ncbi:MAG: CHAP domain-containing protein, partial [Streptococcus salivarius]
MKKLKWYLLSSLIPLFFPVFIIIIIMGAVGGGSTGGSSQSPNGTTYTDHWSNGDPYTHNLLVHRYGIKAEQLDGFLDTLGISYDKKRINGKKLLDWEAKSNLDVRAIVAIALNESSLGTAGVATNPGSNMFGFGAFDSNPENANNFNDEVAVVGLTNQTIIGNKNETFKVQDDKAQKFASGSLNTSTDGGVYFTDTSGSGKRRAETMQKLDTYIDEHG